VRRLKAARLARMLQTRIFDVDDAAAFLGIQPESLRAAAYRRRISSVQYAGRTYFAYSDLADYRADRDRGRASNVMPGKAHFVHRFRPNRVQSHA
jgi:hypothetical protein